MSKRNSTGEGFNNCVDLIQIERKLGKLCREGSLKLSQAKNTATALGEGKARTAAAAALGLIVALLVCAENLAFGATNTRPYHGAGDSRAGSEVETREAGLYLTEKNKFFTTFAIVEERAFADALPGVEKNLENGVALLEGVESLAGFSGKVGCELQVHESIKIVERCGWLADHAIIVDSAEVGAAGIAASTKLLGRCQALDCQVASVEPQQGDRKPIEGFRKLFRAGGGYGIHGEPQGFKGLIGPVARQLL